MFQTCSRCGFDWHGHEDKQALCPDCRTTKYDDHPGHRWALACINARLGIELTRSGLKIGQIREVEVYLRAAVRSKPPDHLEMERDEHELVARTRGYRIVLEEAAYAFDLGEWDRVLEILRLAPPAVDWVGTSRQIA